MSGDLDDFCVLIGDGMTDAGGLPCRVYRALKAILCSRCKAAINPGELFTRREVDARLRLTSCSCATCLPFQLDPAASPEGRQRHQPDNYHARVNTHAVRHWQQAEESVRRAVAERPGPALRRGESGAIKWRRRGGL